MLLNSIQFHAEDPPLSYMSLIFGTLVRRDGDAWLMDLNITINTF